jgi:hypothetical protein
MIQFVILKFAYAVQQRELVCFSERGKITFESKEGKGTKFIIEIPVEQ